MATGPVTEDDLWGGPDTHTPAAQSGDVTLYMGNQTPPAEDELWPAPDVQPVGVSQLPPALPNPANAGQRIGGYTYDASGRPYVPQGVAPPPDGYPTPPPPPVSDEGLGFMREVQRPLDNLTQWTTRGLSNLGVPTEKLDAMFGVPDERNSVANNQAPIDAAAQRGVVPGKIGSFLGGLLGIAPVAAIAPESIIAQGALGSALSTQHPDSLANTAADALVGGVAGKAGDLAMSGLLNTVAPKIASGAQYLMDRGVPLTTGQMTPHSLFGLAEKTASVTPIAGEFKRAADVAALHGFNRAAYNEALAPAGVKLPVDTALGPDALNFVRGVKNDAYSAVGAAAPTVQLGMPYATGMQDIGARLQQLPPNLKSDFANFYQRSIAGRVQSDGSGITGPDMINAMSDLRGKIQNIKTASSRDQFDNQYLNDVLIPMREHLMDTLGNSSPEAAAALQNANQINSGYMALKNTLAKVNDRQTTGEGIFLPQQLSVGAKQGASMDARAYGNLWGQDLINAGKTTLPTSYGNINPLKDPHVFGEGAVTAGVAAADLMGGHGAAAPLVAGIGGLGALYHPAIQDALRRGLLGASAGRRAAEGLLGPLSGYTAPVAGLLGASAAAPLVGAVGSQ